MHREAALPRRHGQLLVAAGEDVLRRAAGQAGAQGGAAAVASDDDLRRHLTHGIEARYAPGEVVVDQPLPEVDADAPRLLRPGHQELVELAAGHRVDELAFAAAVGKQGELPVQCVRHPAEHRDRLAKHVVVEAYLVQRMEPARGDRQVDRAAGGNAHVAHVGPPLVHVDRVPLASEHERQQRADRPRSDDDQIRHRPAHRSARRAAERPRSRCKAEQA